MAGMNFKTRSSTTANNFILNLDLAEKGTLCK
ncbi:MULTISPECIES: hypothetical protein [Robinsoniella]|nr:hypothetical protein [Clostridiales bacterium]